MFNANATFLLLDAAQRIILLVGAQHAVTLFVQRNILDTKLASVPTTRWQTEIQPNMPKGGFYTLKKGQVAALDIKDVSDITKQKAVRARLLAEGYGFLLWHANMATEAYWSTSSIDYSDLPLLATQRQALIDLYATTKGLSQAEAKKQLDFDEQTLFTLALRRKEILWKYEDSLLKVSNQTELDAWKNGVKNDTINVGAV